MEKKVESGELTENSLKSEANGMIGKMGENSMFKKMMGQMETKDMAEARDSALPNVSKAPLIT